LDTTRTPSGMTPTEVSRPRMTRLSVAVSTPMGQLYVQRRQFVHVPKAMSLSLSRSSSVIGTFAPTHRGKTRPVQSWLALKILRSWSAL
jgi:hypothetical protein